MNKLLVCFGTRPEYIKIKPLLKSMGGVIPYHTLFTGQHTDLIDFKADYSFDVIDGKDRLTSILHACAQSDIISNFEYVMVQGDTTTAVGIALSAFNRRTKIIHLEAGLRSHDMDNPFPEEANRKIITTLSSINLCPTKGNVLNIVMERGSDRNCYVVGNTVLDNLIDVIPTYSNKILITLHRRENHPILPEWFSEISLLAKNHKDHEFILPLHPNPNVQKCREFISDDINVIPPVPYDDMVNILGEIKFAISDSGGVQEECAFLKKHVVVCRKTTERPEGLGTFNFLCKTPKDVHQISNPIFSNYRIINQPCPFGNGHSSEIIVDILKRLIL